ncbi:MAG TPA: helix-turn-helix domain-containing protein, partial [Lacipirellulaceae bacterium]|nr:helix-turn-helix domain-containing protein [Lacipirellulaceae bacterium]
MSGIIPKVSLSVKEKMSKRFRKCSIAAVRNRYLIIFNLWNGRSARMIETILDVHNTTVYRVAKRFRELGEASLWDGRESNGAEKLSETFLGVLDKVVRSSP